MATNYLASAKAESCITKALKNGPKQIMMDLDNIATNRNISQADILSSFEFHPRCESK